MGMTIYHIHQSQKGGMKEKMNTFRKMKKNAKALSPVVASIILIAVTVAVSIAVAACMPYTLPANTPVTITFDAVITTGDNYEIKIVTSKNNPFVTTARAPT